MDNKCETCNSELSNPIFILRELTNIGYLDYEFCNVKCLLTYIIKRFKRKIKKALKSD